MSVRRRTQKRKPSFSDISDEDDDESLESSCLSGFVSSTDGDMSTQQRSLRQNWPSALLLDQPMTERQQLAVLQKMTAHENSEYCMGSQRCVPPRGKRRWFGVKRVNRKNARGDAPMHLAAKKGNLNKIKSLLEKGADVNTQCFAGWTPLHEACLIGSVPVVEALLKAGADVNMTSNDKVTPLHDAASSGCLEAVQLLLQYGSDPSAKNSQGKTAMDLATTVEIRNCLHSHLEKMINSRGNDSSLIIKTEVNNREEFSQASPGSKPVGSASSLQLLTFDYKMPASMKVIPGSALALTEPHGAADACQQPRYAVLAYRASPNRQAFPVAMAAYDATTSALNVAAKCSGFTFTPIGTKDGGASRNGETRQIAKRGSEECRVRGDRSAVDVFSSFSECKSLCDGGEQPKSEVLPVMFPKCEGFQNVGNYEEVSSSSTVSWMQDEQEPQPRKYLVGLQNPHIPSTGSGTEKVMKLGPYNKFTCPDDPSAFKPATSVSLPTLKCQKLQHGTATAFCVGAANWSENFGNRLLCRHSVGKSHSEPNLQTTSDNSSLKHPWAHPDGTVTKTGSNSYLTKQLVVSMNDVLTGRTERKYLTTNSNLLLCNSKSSNVQRAKLQSGARKSRMELCKDSFWNYPVSKSDWSALHPEIDANGENIARNRDTEFAINKGGKNLKSKRRILKNVVKCLEKTGDYTRGMKKNCKSSKTDGRQPRKTLASAEDFRKWNLAERIPPVNTLPRNRASMVKEPGKDVTMELERNRLLLKSAKTLSMKSSDVGLNQNCDLSLTSFGRQKKDLHSVLLMATGVQKGRSTTRENSVEKSTDEEVASHLKTSVDPVNSAASNVDDRVALKARGAAMQKRGSSLDRMKMMSTPCIQLVDRGTMTVHSDWDLARIGAESETACRAASVPWSNSTLGANGGRMQDIDRRFVSKQNADQETCCVGKIRNSAKITAVNRQHVDVGTSVVQAFASSRYETLAPSSLCCGIPWDANSSAGAENLECSESAQPSDFAHSHAKQSLNSLRRLAYVANLTSLKADRSLLQPLLSEQSTPVPSAFSLRTKTSSDPDSSPLLAADCISSSGRLRTGLGAYDGNIALLSAKPRPSGETRSHSYCERSSGRASGQFGRRLVNLKRKNQSKAKNSDKRVKASSDDTDSDNSSCSRDGRSTLTTPKLANGVSAAHGKRKPLGSIWQKNDPVSFRRSIYNLEHALEFQDQKKNYILWHGLRERKANSFDWRIFESKNEETFNSQVEQDQQNCLKEFGNFMTFTGKYSLCTKNAISNVEIVAPNDLEFPMKSLYIKQEKERQTLVQQHCKERERLLLNGEAEIMRACASEDVRSRIISCCTMLCEHHGGGVEGVRSCKRRDVNNNRISPADLQSCMISLLEKFQKFEKDMLFHHRTEASVLYFRQLNEWDQAVKQCELSQPASVPSSHLCKILVPEPFISDVFGTIKGSAL